MSDVESKVQMLRRFYSPLRYASNPLEHKKLQRIVVEGPAYLFAPLIGFRDASGWTKRCNGSVKFAEAELRKIAEFFHLQEIANDGEEGWQLLKDRYPQEYFAIRLVQKGYGTLREFSATSNGALDVYTTEFLRPLLSFPARDLDIDIVQLTDQRGAAERTELEEMRLLRQIDPWAAYAYELKGTKEVYGHLVVLEISSAIGGAGAICTVVAPSNLHPTGFYSKPMRVPQSVPALQHMSFRMSDKHPRCTTVALVTPQPLQGLPTPKAGNFFAVLPAQDIHLLALQLVRAESPIFRGICNIGLRT